MNAENNKRLMQDIFEAIAKGDGTKFVEHLADDVTMTITGNYSWSQTFKGKESVRRDLYGFVHSRLKEPGKTHAFRFLADEDWVVVEARGDMVTKESVPYQNHYCLMYRLEDNLIVEMKEYQDSAMCEKILGPYPSSQSGAGS